MANLLLKHGADPLLKNALGMAPVDVVTNTSVAKLLENFSPQSEKGQLLGENFFFSMLTPFEETNLLLGNF